MQRDSKYFKSFNYFEGLSLKEKPNVNIFCVESYGSLVFLESKYSKLKKYIKTYESKLSEMGYYYATALSTPPLFAGGSWKSYTSFNYGTKVQDDTQFTLMFKKSEGFSHYHSIFHILREQGYSNILLSGLGKDIDKKFDWDFLKENFQCEHLYQWKDLEYQGKETKFFNVRECPPDQYTLGKGLAIVDQNHGEGPHSLFYISLNSHYPYRSPVERLESWEKMNTQLDFKVNDGESDIYERYESAIKYQIDTFFSTIIERAEQEELFLVFGDHQPPFVAKKTMGLETPVHIFSKKKAFIQPFLDQGFKEGLLPNENKDDVFKHEAMLSLIMMGLDRAYASDERKIEYRPDGAIFMD